MNVERRFGTRTTKENILPNDSVTTQPHGLGTNMKNKVNLSQTPQSSQSVENEPADETIFRSPLITILASLDYSRPVSQRISCHDLVDAYSTITLGLKTNIVNDSSLDPNSLGLPMKPQASEFVCAVRRDSKSVLYGPSSDEQTESVPVSENEVQTAWNTATLSNHALRLVSVIFGFPHLQSFFTVKHLTSLLDDVLTILLTQSLPTPNASRTHGLLLWILQVQKLNTSIIITRQEKILQVTDLALRGVYQGNHSVIDGLKIMARFLHKSQKEIQHYFCHHFDKILPFLVSASPAQRFYATSVLSAFAYAKINKNIEPEHYFPLRDRLHSFLRIQSGTEANPEPRLTDFLQQALVPGRSRFEGAQWAVVTIASIIVLLDGSTFNSGWAATTIKMFGLIHKISTIDAMIPLIWNCLIWSFSRLPSNQKSRYNAFDVFGQEVRRGNGNALVATLLRCMSLSDTPDPDCVLSDALLVVDAMAGHQDTDTRRQGLELLYKLSSGGDSANPPGEDLTFLLNPILFDGTVLNTKSGLEAIVRKIKPVEATLARCLTEMEVQQHWDSLLGIWSKSLLAALEVPEPDIQGIFFDIWQFLLLVPTQLTPQQCHLTASTAFVNEASDMVLRFINHGLVSRAEKQQLFVVQRLWDTLHRVFTPQDLIQPSKALLKAVIRRNFSIENGATLSQWIILCHALSSNRSAELRIDFSESWVIIAQIVLQNNYCPDRLIAFLRLPLTLSFANEDYVQSFGDLLRSSDEVSRAFQGITTSVTAFWGHLWPERCYSPSSYPHLVHCIFQSIDRYATPISLEDRQLLNSILSELHPAHLSADACVLPLKYVALAGHIVSATPDEHLLTTLSFLSDFLTTWIQDKSRVVADDEYNRAIVPVYCTIVQRLSTFEASTTIMKDLDSLLISPLERCPHPGRATQAFIKFWRETYHHRTPEFYPHYSEDLKEALKCLDIVFRVGFTQAFSLSTDSQIEDESFIVPETIPTPSPQRPSTTARPQLPPITTSSSPSHRNHQSINISSVNAEISTDSRKRKAESQTSGQTTRTRKRKAMVMECVQLSHRNRTVTQGTKRSCESQLMTPEPSRYSSESPFRNRLIVEPDTEPDNDGHELNVDNYDWDRGNVSISDVKEALGDGMTQVPKQYPHGRLEAASPTSVSRPNKRRRQEDFQSDTVISTTLIRPEPIGRARTVPTGSIFVSELQRLHQSFNDTMSVQDLLQAQRLIHSFGTSISQALEKQIGGNATDAQD
ncbi:hypothetical protein E1B28_012293 [Marasmius oreades]|uniref:Telomere-associated protein Rif1 N-terminal domain-containing protein n=1 Tax=Marasmius oreades TaxID=181124 RepID=A0A9P7UNS8_9AGAR|nr:uncharacterized protein E1B28_012293 [Marasmius oreades]KAG7088280.1 hypothetical protein E1B28_012293 [Marasmius oreades]